MSLGQSLGLSEGNLACHVGRLVRAGLLEIRSNGARGRASRTEFAISEVGRIRLAVVGDGLAVTARAIAAALAVPADQRVPALDVQAQEPAGARERASAPGRAQPEILHTVVEELFSGPD